MNKIRIAVIGAGQRGKDVYGENLKKYEQVEVTAVVEPNDYRREEFKKSHKIKEEMVFKNIDDFFKKEDICDAVIIATPDDKHFKPAIEAIKKRYHILLEKPMSNDLNECVKLTKEAVKSDKAFMVCHVLRYTPFFSEIKKLLDEKAIGKLISIQHNENIGYYHFAHSFVRGNWRSSKESSPLILAKSCHDMDILVWLAGSKAKNISSYGNLSFFNKENAPDRSSDRCINCSIEETCVFSAKKIYLNSIGSWPTTVVSDIQSIEAVLLSISQNNYGRCVFKCDNDVVDNQVTIVEFENGVTSTFNLCAFTNEINRTIKLMGTKGEIRGNMGKNEIELKKFGEDDIIIRPQKLNGGHGGGDFGIMEDFISIIKDGIGKNLTKAEISLESHVMAFAAEESRIKRKNIDTLKFHSI